MTRQSTPPSHEQRQAQITRDLQRAVGGIEAVAEYTGKGKSQIGRYQSPKDPDSITLRDIELLEGVTHGKDGHPVITSYLAKQAGYVLVKLPNVTATGTDLLKLVADQAKENGDIASTIINAVADGKINGKEPQQIRKEIWDAITLAVTMDAELELIEQGCAQS